MTSSQAKMVVDHAEAKLVVANVLGDYAINIAEVKILARAYLDLQSRVSPSTDTVGKDAGESLSGAIEQRAEREMDEQRAHTIDEINRNFGPSTPREVDELAMRLVNTFDKAQWSWFQVAEFASNFLRRPLSGEGMEALRCAPPEWLPIESAPRDGTEILLLTPNGYAIGLRQEQCEVGLQEPGHDAGWYGEGPRCDPVTPGRTREAGFPGADHWIYPAANQPTHWLPLPALPEIDEDDTPTQPKPSAAQTIPASAPSTEAVGEDHG